MLSFLDAAVIVIPCVFVVAASVVAAFLSAAIIVIPGVFVVSAVVFAAFLDRAGHQGIGKARPGRQVSPCSQGRGKATQSRISQGRGKADKVEQ